MILIKSTIGKKILVALTGLVLFGFIVAHLMGNLLIFLGPAAINDYSARLRENLALLWTARVVLLISFVLHIILTVQLARLNRAARPVGYESFDPARSTAASRTMIWGGVVILFYVIYHILHLTTGTVHPNFVPHDVYGNLLNGFSNGLVVSFYVLANVALGFHLYHGAWSLFQTLGFNHPKYNGARRTLASLFAYSIAVGYISIPAAVFLGIVK